MSDEMKQVLKMLAALTAQVGELTAEVATLKKTPKTPAKEEKPDTSFAALYGKLFVNADGSGKKFKHPAEMEDGSEDDWFAIWDAKNKVLKRFNDDDSETDEVYETFGEFGTAHYKSLGEQNKKSTTNIGNGGWDKVKVYDTSPSASSSPPTRCCRWARSRARRAAPRAPAAAPTPPPLRAEVRSSPSPSPRTAAASLSRARRSWRRRRTAALAAAVPAAADRRRPPPTAADAAPTPLTAAHAAHADADAAERP
jgi:hypothetical protein